MRPVPIMTAGHTLGGTIFCREICQRPNGIKLRLNLLWQIGAPGVAVTVYLLSGTTWANINGLG